MTKNVLNFISSMLEIRSVMLWHVIIFAGYTWESTWQKVFIFYFPVGMCFVLFQAGVHEFGYITFMKRNNKLITRLDRLGSSACRNVPFYFPCTKIGLLCDEAQISLVTIKPVRVYRMRSAFT